MAGLVGPNATPAQLAEHRDTYLANLTWAAERAAAAGVDILIEPINRRDMPGYFLTTQPEAHALVPDRHEPDHGELDIRHLLGVIDDLGFHGWVGCKYRPRAGTSAGLGWLNDYRGAHA
jgi:hydroxypyruvate isomerase